MLLIAATHHFEPIPRQPNTKLSEKLSIAAQVPQDWMKMCRAPGLKLQLPMKPRRGKRPQKTLREDFEMPLERLLIEREIPRVRQCPENRTAALALINLSQRRAKTLPALF